MTKSGCLKVLLIGSALLPSLAHAIMPPDVYRNSRINADHHVQITVTQVTPPLNTDQGKCTVQGEVARVFKGNLKIGASVNLTLSCEEAALGRAAIPTPRMVGGALYTPTSTVQRARFLEAFITGSPPDIVNDQAVILPALTAQPRCNASAQEFRCRVGTP
jgi:hypothetical protein